MDLTPLTTFRQEARCDYSTAPEPACGSFTKERLTYLYDLLSVVITMVIFNANIQGATPSPPKKNLAHFFVCLITSSNVDQFSNYFHCQNREKICTSTITKDPTAPQFFGPPCIQQSAKLFDETVRSSRSAEN